MSELKILDCTLRDGGYVNNWNFGYTNIKSILYRLTNSNIDIVECGFLEDSMYDKEYSIFNNVEEIEKLLPVQRENTEFVAMTRYGNLKIQNLKEYDGRSINGIRVTFHIHEVEEAIEYCKNIKNKGYKVYVQPVGTTSYDDITLLKIINIINSIKPHAFYIVDTLGLMKKNDLLRMFYLIDNNLDKEIAIGFHSHNNLQLSFSNAQELTVVHTKRMIILDSSVYGMGRGAGNLNTELIAQHLNAVCDKNYNTDFLLEVIDESIKKLKEKYTWGYSVPYYLAAINNCHPDYATYLLNRKTLPVKVISNILKTITNDKSELYDKKYISDLYTHYQKHNIDDAKDIEKLTQLLIDREIVIIAPGSSVRKNYESIKKYIEKNNAIVISVNFDGDCIKPDFCFFSNIKRFQKFKETKLEIEQSFKIIITSNNNVEYKYYNYMINYSDFLNNQGLVNDNATLMLIALLIKLKVKQIHIAGFDGFEFNIPDNYAYQELETHLDEDILKEMNEQIYNVVSEYSDIIRINFITKSLYQVN